jgi:chromosomal replication initiator protein
VRDIEGMLTRLHALSHLDKSNQKGKGIGRALIERLFEVAAGDVGRKPVRFAVILDGVADHLHVERAAILGNGRNRHVVLARSLTIHLARMMTSMSYPEIAAAMGRSNHSTIITAAKRIKAQLSVPQAEYTLPGTLQPILLVDLADQLIHQIQSASQ